MPISDKSTGPRFTQTQTDTEKNETTADRLLRIARRCINCTRKDIRRMSVIIDKAPGTKAQILATLTTAEKDELELIFTAMKAIGNTHKPANTPTLTETSVELKSDRQSIREAT